MATSCGLMQDSSSGPSSVRSLDEAGMAESSDTDAIDRLVATDQRCQRPGGGIGLAVDVEPHVGEPLEQFAHHGDRRASVDPNVSEFLGAHVGDRALDATRPGEVGIVERHQDPVGAEVHVGLEVLEPERHRVFERRHRVLRRFAGAAPMRERDGTGPVEVRMDGGHGPTVASTSRRGIDGRC